MRDILLGVNIDHVATLRQARGTRYPDPVQAAFLAEEAGADAITVHLREDRRHIQDRDLEILVATIQTRINLECAITGEMIAIACGAQPADVCLVPERRAELTTEGGLDVSGQKDTVVSAIEKLSEHSIRVSLFIDPDREQIQAAHEVGATVVELHTGTYANANSIVAVEREYRRICEAAKIAADLGLQVNAGHGLHRHNVEPIAAISVIQELNIGHAIIAHALFVGLKSAVSEMKQIMKEARRFALQSAQIIS